MSSVARSLIRLIFRQAAKIDRTEGDLISPLGASTQWGSHRFSRAAGGREQRSTAQPCSSHQPIYRHPCTSLSITDLRIVATEVLHELAPGLDLDLITPASQSCERGLPAEPSAGPSSARSTPPGSLTGGLEPNVSPLSDDKVSIRRLVAAAFRKHRGAPPERHQELMDEVGTPQWLGRHPHVNF